jgi:hypothetical protein
MINEAKFYQYFKNKTPQFSFTRIENTTALGTPDVLVYNKKGHFFTIEFKVIKSYKIRFSPHQIAFHVKHPLNSFIMVTRAMKPEPILYGGYQIRDLVASGLRLEPIAKSLDACVKRLEAV